MANQRALLQARQGEQEKAKPKKPMAKRVDPERNGWDDEWSDEDSDVVEDLEPAGPAAPVDLLADAMASDLAPPSFNDKLSRDLEGALWPNHPELETLALTSLMCRLLWVAPFCRP